MLRPIIDLTGQRFGKWSVVKRTSNGRRGETRWFCQCDCGTRQTISTGNLRGGLSKQCRACFYLYRKQGTKHGASKTRLYHTWHGMKQRCINPNAASYKHYGARGISVCKEWENSFETFRDWALSHGYKEDLTIDRIDNDGNYSPENCKWSTYKENLNNKSDSRFITIAGCTKTMTQWADFIGISREAMRKRLLSKRPSNTLLAPPRPGRWAKIPPEKRSHSKETRRKMSESHKRMHQFNRERISNENVVMEGI